MITNTDRQAIDLKIKEAARWIWVTFQKAGFHRYPAAAEEAMLQDVAYLANVHRHLFKFKIGIQVWHDDREIEFHQFLNFCEALLDNNVDIDFKSVEMLANDLYVEIASKYPNRKVKIEVSEDGECGCQIEYN